MRHPTSLDGAIAALAAAKDSRVGKQRRRRTHKEIAALLWSPSYEAMLTAEADEMPLAGAVSYSFYLVEIRCNGSVSKHLGPNPALSF